MLRIFTDFDGPIMDVSERYYQVYQVCLAQAREQDQTVTVLPKEQFWQMKRAQVPERHIGQMSGLHDDQARRFAQLRRETVHSLPYLRHDRVLPGAATALERLQSLGCDLVVVTMRRAHTLNLVLEQQPQIGRFFPTDRRYCLADDYLKDQDVVEKPRLMARALAQLPPQPQSWMIGDTEADIAAARAHGIPIVAVLSGIRNRERLLAYGPDAIVDNLPQAVDAIVQQAPAMSVRGL
ncbi:HAD family hydrolase [Leptolyngbya sp. PCC 6406]|uniref:HAD family hydrolase n=1 Tax=Leptolyngbya sp. PCC 6406 TaxID=1173264 RepID=UPI0002AC1DB2|nr:HAD family hydrolase [Leptolyngbya sp. PCC 6406]